MTRTPKPAARAKTAPARTTIRRAPAKVPARVPQPSKDELRQRIEKLETANARLRSKSREASRAARDAAGRIAELEAALTRNEKAAAPPRPRRARKSAAPAAMTDMGAADDAAPPGVDRDEPAPPDAHDGSAHGGLETDVDDA